MCASSAPALVGRAPRRGGRDDGEDGGDPSHGPGATWDRVAVAGLAVGERAAVGERDRVVGGVDGAERALVAARAAAVVAGVERAGERVLAPGSGRVEDVGQAAGTRDAERVEGRADAADAADRVDVARSGRSRRTSRRARACRRGRTRGWSRRCDSAQTVSPKAPWVKSSSAAICRSSAFAGPGPQSGEPEPTAASASVGLEPGELDEVVVAAGALDDRVEVADRRHRVGGGGAQLGQERAAARAPPASRRRPAGRRRRAPRAG